jgi:hypothetical protein
MNLHEFMHTPAATCSRETTATQVAQLMETSDVGSVVVLDAAGQLAGIVTDRDLAIRAVGHRREPDTPIQELMTPNVVFLRDDTNVFAAATEMATAQCRRMPVIGRDGHVKGCHLARRPVDHPRPPTRQAGRSGRRRDANHQARLTINSHRGPPIGIAAERDVVVALIEPSVVRNCQARRPNGHRSRCEDLWPLLHQPAGRTIMWSARRRGSFHGLRN